MPNLITVKVDVSKLDKARFFRGKPDASGHAPLYADLVLVPRREPGRYGDTHLVKQSKKRDEAVEMPILGNATERGASAQSQAPAQRPAPAPQHDINDEDVPF
jgi:hypothetical protein